MSIFRRALRMEWRRISTVRSSWLISALALISAGGLGAAVAATATGPADVALAASVVDPGRPAPVAILLGVLGVLAWGHDHRFGTIRPVLGVVPQRRVLAAARLTVVTGWMTVVAAASVAAAGIAGVVASGGDLADPLGTAPIPRMMLGSVVFGVGCGWLGAGLGALARSMPVAVGLLFAVPAMIEPLIALVLGKIDAKAVAWLPFYAAGQFVGRTPVVPGPSPAVGALIFLGLGVAVVAAAVTAFTRRDA